MVSQSSDYKSNQHVDIPKIFAKKRNNHMMPLLSFYKDNYFIRPTLLNKT